MYQLYYASGTCAMAVHVVLNELNIPYEAKKISFDKGENKTPEFLALNPRGQVPVLVSEDHVLREGAAILITLLDRHPNELLPQEGWARAQALEWLCFANATLHPAYGKVFGLHKQFGDKATENPMYDTGIAQVQKLWDEVESRLQENDYIAGASMTVADILLTVIANWGLRKPIQFGPRTKALLTRVSQRPSYQEAMNEEGVTYKAAA